MAAGLALPGVFWMGKWFYALPDRRLVDRRLTDEFLAQLTRRYSIAVGVELLAIPVAALSPRAGVALSVGVVALFLIPSPKPRYRDGQAPVESDVAPD